MGSISCHITSLVINILGGGDTHTNAHTHMNAHTHTSIQKQVDILISKNQVLQILYMIIYIKLNKLSWIRN